ncbi:MAG: hypothetical protein AVDCRST_MAG48-1228 [uncultured Friedmanniella sp.]|uniref:DUF4188 domain-containing protein n=1 Tax=uncultured Friedmanniella sp. TaxID=335381 RepID=A0A6J4K9M6_9ACTN|nr:MAG: hypothetical protein AVDCRST_MAG48-1228 [uncultured Friedmanniella sp.]
MPPLVPRRMTHDHDGELVVFLIGMRFNRPWRPDQWLPVFAAMPKMLAELSRDPDSGLLGHRLLLGAGGPTVVQYWSSTEKLYAYASRPDAEHRPAWSAFNRRARAVAGAVGIWHETYVVDRAESVYVGTPTMGLAAATASVPVGCRGEGAAERLRNRTGDAAAA